MLARDDGGSVGASVADGMMDRSGWVVITGWLVGMLADGV